MKSLDLFLPHVLPSVLGASEPLVKQALVRAAREFCTRTNLIQDVFTVNEAAGVGEYDVDIPSQQQLLRLTAVMVDEREITLVPTVHVTRPTALRGEAVSGTEPMTGTPTAAFFKTATGSTFWVYPLPAEAGTESLTVRACYAPRLTATTVDDALYDDWLDTIVAGALMRLHAVKNQPFSSMPAATEGRQEFEVGVSRGKAEALRGRVVGSLHVRQKAFA